MGTMVGIKVEGLSQLNRALKAIDAMDERKELRVALKAAAEVVAQDAQRRTPVRSGRARGSIRAGVTTKGAYVAGGKKSVPYYGWLDFGSRSPRSGNPRSVGPWRGSGTGPKEGRFIYPALRSKYDEVVRLSAAAVERAINAEGFR
jgi:HK97 gp10 family phage protein